MKLLIPVFVCVGLFVAGCSSFHTYDKGRDDRAKKLLEEIDKLDLRSVVKEARNVRREIFEGYISSAAEHTKDRREELFFEYAAGNKKFGVLKEKIENVSQLILGEKVDLLAGLNTYKDRLANDKDLKARADSVKAHSVNGFVDHIRMLSLDLKAQAGTVEQAFGISGIECPVVPTDLLPIGDPSGLERTLKNLKKQTKKTIFLPDKPAKGCGTAETRVQVKSDQAIQDEKELFRLAGLKRPQELVKLAPQQIKKQDQQTCEERVRDDYYSNLEKSVGLTSMDNMENIDLGSIREINLDYSEEAGSKSKTIIKIENRVEVAARFARFYGDYAFNCANARDVVLTGLAVFQDGGIEHKILDKADKNCKTSLVDRISGDITLQDALLYDNCSVKAMQEEKAKVQSAKQALKAADDALKKASKNEKKDEESKKTLSDYLAMVTKSIAQLENVDSIFGTELLSEEESTALEIAAGYLENEPAQDAESTEENLSLELRRALAVVQGIPEIEDAIKKIEQAGAPVVVALEAKKNRAALMKEFAERRVELLEAERDTWRALKDDGLEALSLLGQAIEKYNDSVAANLSDKNIPAVLEDKKLPYQEKENVLTALISVANAESIFTDAKDRALYNLIALQSDRDLLADEMKAASHQDLIVMPARTLAAWHATGITPEALAHILVNAMGFTAVAIEAD